LEGAGVGGRLLAAHGHAVIGRGLSGLRRSMSSKDSMTRLPPNSYRLWGLMHVGLESQAGQVSGEALGTGPFNSGPVASAGLISGGGEKEQGQEGAPVGVIRRRSAGQPGERPGSRIRWRERPRSAGRMRGVFVWPSWEGLQLARGEAFGSLVD
jgi:hypothetical protein